MKKLFFVFLIINQLSLVSSNLRSGKVILGVSSLVAGMYLAKNTYDHNALVPEKVELATEFRNNFNAGKLRPSYSMDTEACRTAFSDYSITYLETYHYLPWGAKFTHNDNEIKEFFKKATKNELQECLTIINQTTLFDCKYQGYSDCAILFTFSVLTFVIDIVEYRQKIVPVKR